MDSVQCTLLVVGQWVSDIHTACVGICVRLVCARAVQDWADKGLTYQAFESMR